MPIINGNERSVKPSTLKELVAGSHVFITGVTGFIGGALLQRILSIDPGPAKVYALIRDRHNEDPRQRLDKVLSGHTFAMLSPDKLQKAQAIVGECGSKNLGMSDEDRQMLMSKCDLVFHSAALISFGAAYDRIFRINTCGTRSVLELARNMAKIKAMVYVSTAFIECDVNKTDGVMQEKVYQIPIDPVEYSDLVDQVSADEFKRRIRMNVNERWGNSYTISKILAECVLEKERGNVPIAIIRPSIVLNSWKKPVPGCIDNINNGVAGLLVGISYGMFRSYHLPKDALLNVIPVDMVVSTILTAALSVSQDSSEVQVYNCTMCPDNPLSVPNYLRYIVKASRKIHSNVSVFYPNITCGKNSLRHWAKVLLFQLVPAYVISSSLKHLRPRESYEIWDAQIKYLKIHAYGFEIMSVLRRFNRTKTDRLDEMLTIEEQNEHPMNPRLIDWEEYIETCVIGSRKYLRGDLLTSKKRFALTTVLKILWLTSPFTGFVIVWLLLSFLGCSANISIFLSICVIAFLIWL